MSCPDGTLGSFDSRVRVLSIASCIFLAFEACRKHDQPQASNSQWTSFWSGQEALWGARRGVGAAWGQEQL